MQIRDLITQLQACGDDSQYIEVSTDEGERSQDLAILEVCKTGSRNWAIHVSKPAPDEEAIEEIKAGSFAEGYSKAKADAVSVIESLKHED